MSEMMHGFSELNTQFACERLVWDYDGKNWGSPVKNSRSICRHPLHWEKYAGRTCSYGNPCVTHSFRAPLIGSGIPFEWRGSITHLSESFVQEAVVPDDRLFFLRQADPQVAVCTHTAMQIFLDIRGVIQGQVILKDLAPEGDNTTR